jgi:Cytidine and deoxycytidylate deaminase zinc-binding region
VRGSANHDGCALKFSWEPAFCGQRKRPMSAATDWTQETARCSLHGTGAEPGGTAVSRGQTPFGAVVLDAAGRLIGEGHNTVRADLDPAAHAEIVALRAAWREVGAWPISRTARLEGGSYARPVRFHRSD